MSKTVEEQAAEERIKRSIIGDKAFFYGLIENLRSDNEEFLKKTYDSLSELKLAYNARNLEEISAKKRLRQIIQKEIAPYYGSLDSRDTIMLRRMFEDIGFPVHLRVEIDRLNFAANNILPPLPRLRSNVRIGAAPAPAPAPAGTRRTYRGSTAAIPMNIVTETAGERALRENPRQGGKRKGKKTRKAKKSRKAKKTRKH